MSYPPSLCRCSARILDGKWRMLAGRIRLCLFYELEYMLSISALKIGERARYTSAKPSRVSGDENNIYVSPPIEGLVYYWEIYIRLNQDN